MKKQYTSPEIEVLELKNASILTEVVEEDTFDDPDKFEDSK